MDKGGLLRRSNRVAVIDDVVAARRRNVYEISDSTIL